VRNAPDAGRQVHGIVYVTLRTCDLLASEYTFEVSGMLRSTRADNVSVAHMKRIFSLAYSIILLVEMYQGGFGNMMRIGSISRYVSRM
jgi:hypothetical protein